MKKLFILATLAFSSNALAHIELGTYKGKADSGEECSFEVTNVSHNYDIHHPLNERVTIKIENVEFVLQHLPLIDTASKTVTFQKGKLTAAVGTEEGSLALILNMIHSQAKEGPDSLELIWNAKTATDSDYLVCRDLTHVAR